MSLQFHDPIQRLLEGVKLLTLIINQSSQKAGHLEQFTGLDAFVCPE